MTKKEKKLIWAYREVFVQNPQGQQVLTDILNDLGFFSQNLESQEDLALHNAATVILQKVGVWRPHNLFAVTDSLTSLPAFADDERYD